jgi:hypothetical protein
MTNPFFYSINKELSLLIRFETSNIYRAIYLEQLTAKELTDKIVQRMTNPPHITSMVRKRKNGDKTILVQVDDDVVKAMAEEQDIYVTCQSSMLILDF